MPFDRLVRAVDEWATLRGRDDVLAQIGATSWRPRRIRYTDFISPVEFTGYMRRADVIIAHAGIGSIFMAMELRKPILVMPRQASLGETRNDHQLATARHLARYAISVAMDETELIAWLERLSELGDTAPMPSHASSELLGTLRAFVDRPCSAHPHHWPALGAGKHP